MPYSSLKSLDMKIISAPFHAIIDYLFVLILAIAPSLLHLSTDAANISYIFAGIHLLLTLLTQNKGGLIGLVPFRVHGLIEFVAGAAFLGLAFWFSSKNNQQAYYYFLALGVLCMLVFFFTDYSKSSNLKSI
jgi:hypothetical protein